VAKTIFDVLDDRLVAAIDDQELFVTSGGAKTLEAYKEACGVIRGLTLARRDLQDLAKNYMEENDD
jgi:hypothetical protein